MNLNLLTNKLSIIALASVAVLSSCKKDEDSSSSGSSNVISSDFNYETSVKSGFYFQVPDYLSNASFEIYTADPEDGGKLLAEGKFNATTFESTYVLPSSLESVYFKSTYVGLPGGFEIPVSNGLVTYQFEGSRQQRLAGTSGGYSPEPSTWNSVVYNFMGNYNSSGVPYYLENPGDVLDQTFVDMVDASLPENQPVPTYNPHYLASSNETNIILNDSADVWVTFVSEGAGYKNVLAYYSYDLNNPPATKNDIDTIHFIFPNASFYNSGGGLYAGDKVYLGAFSANTGIGWVLLQNAYNSSNNSVNLNKTHLYSTNEWNPESSASLRQHTVALYDSQRDLILVGFEDQIRTSSDQDFNDCVFYATANPITAINTGQIPPITQGGNDDDGDGVPNSQDEYPNDPDKAFNNYTPFENGYSSNAFEDLWPSEGDYDFNDLIVNYNFNHITNGTNELVELEWQFVVKHIGASFHNGFGIELPFAPSQVASVTGYNFTENIVTLNGNGTEANQSKAVIMVFDDAFDNEYDTINMTITLASPYSFSSFNQSGWNPFIFVDGVRSHEVHLPNAAPTDLMNTALLGTGADDSDPSIERYYKTSANKPWAINISHDYEAPVEKVRIENAYLKFEDWVNSNGTQYTDWYEALPGYRDALNIQ
ncbi:MAG: hypothetical protein CL843_13810 [Crocinitomicaceae bacterium]|nr:hypothetical protein [Crocinitomicaceae bacterium]|tara:strand:+ start:3052 stop:5007 length:1956 start_codon:yes stop_codon:yes gene_type:complete